MGITKQAKLQRELDMAQDFNRNAISSAQAARIERDQAFEARDEVQKKLDGMTSYATSQRLHVRRLFNSIFHLNLELARKAGYIDRVKEMDSGVNVTTATDPLDDIIDRERDNLASARSDRKVASVIEGMDSEILDQVLGRDDEADYDRG